MSFHRILVAAGLGLVAVGVVACGGEPPAGSSPGPTKTSAETPAPSLRDLPAVDLSEVEPSVAEQLLEERRRFEEQRTSLSGEALGQAYGELGLYYQAYGFIDAAWACLRNAELLTDEPKWLYYQAHLALEEQQLESAAEALRRYLVRQPSYAAGWVWLGHSLLQLERFAEAREALEQALSLDPASAAARYRLGQIALQEGEVDSAVEHFEAVLQLQPAASMVRYPLATAYRRQGRSTEAQQQLALRGQRKVAIADPLRDELRVISTGARVHLFRGTLAMRSQNLSAALQEFGKAVEMAPDNSRARLNFGAALAQSGQVDQALEQLREALELGLDADNRSKTHFNLGALERMAGRPDAAREHLRQALRWNPSNRPAQQLLDALSPGHSAAP